MVRYSILIISAIFLSSRIIDEKKLKPTVWLIGDSTVKNGNGKGEGGLWGWGDYLCQQFDTTKIAIRNYALGGRSSRTFITGGLWEAVLAKMKSGDYLIIQFGHNDSSTVNDSTRARGTLKGTGNDTEEIDNLLTKKHEIVHSFGWYIRKYITESKTKGVTPIVCSLIPRNNWENGKVIRSSGDYAKWAEESAVKEKAFYINLNEIISARYDSMGEDAVKTKFFLTDHTHTNEAGAILNAASVAEGIRSLKNCNLKKILKVK